MKSATTASTEMPQPAIAIPVWPVGTKTSATPRRRASRSSSSATVIFPIAQSEPTVSTIVPAPRGSRRSRSRVRRAAGAGRAAQHRAPRELAQLGVVARNTCRPFSTSTPPRRSSCSSVDPCRRETAALCRDADERGVRLEPQRLVDALNDGMPSSVSPGARVESRIATTSSRRYRRTPRIVFP